MRVRGNSLNLRQERLRLAIKKNFFTESTVRHWLRLSRAVVKSLSLEGFSRCVDVAPGDQV